MPASQSGSSKNDDSNDEEWDVSLVDARKRDRKTAIKKSQHEVKATRDGAMVSRVAPLILQP